MDKQTLKQLNSCLLKGNIFKGWRNEQNYAKSNTG